MVRKRIRLGPAKNNCSIRKRCSIRTILGWNIHTSSKKAEEQESNNMQKKDNECLRCTIRTALFSPPKGKNVLRPTSYPNK